jgi:Protein of unknown function (DUF3309)
MAIILAIALFLFFLPALPFGPHARKWGYAPTGIIGALLILVLCLAFFNLLPWWGTPVH